MMEDATFVISRLSYLFLFAFWLIFFSYSSSVFAQMIARGWELPDFRASAWGERGFVTPIREAINFMMRAIAGCKYF